MRPAYQDSDPPEGLVLPPKNFVKKYCSHLEAIWYGFALEETQ